MINNYLTKKKKNLLEYAKTLEELITLENNSLWKKKEEFVNIAKDVIDLYVEDYYFDNNLHRDNPVEYSNDNINSVLKSMIQYCKNAKSTYFLQEKKNETFLLSVIITTSCYVDISTNVVDGDFLATKKKFRYLLEYLQKTNILKVYLNNSRVIKELFDKVKENNNKEEKFFLAFNDPNSYNTYTIYKTKPNYYFVSYNYTIPGLENDDVRLVQKAKEEKAEKFCRVSMEILEIEILRELISNREIGKYIVSLPCKESLFEALDDPRIKEHVLLLLNYEDIKDKQNYITKMENKGFSFVYELADEAGDVFTPSDKDMKVLVSNNWFRRYQEKIGTWEKQGIVFIVKNKEEEK